MGLAKTSGYHIFNKKLTLIVLGFFPLDSYRDFQARFENLLNKLFEEIINA